MGEEEGWLELERGRSRAERKNGESVWAGDGDLRGEGVGSRHFAYRSTKSRPGHYSMANEKATMIHALRAKNCG